jgi:hypothetical protein
MCGSKADYVRRTQFAGDHYFCEEHAKKEKDFLEEDSSTYWKDLNEDS